MREGLSGDGIEDLTDYGCMYYYWSRHRDLNTHTPCKYTDSPVTTLGVHIEVVYGTGKCPGMMDTCDYRLDLIYVPSTYYGHMTTGIPGAIARHKVNLRRVGSASHPREKPPRFTLALGVLKSAQN